MPPLDGALTKFLADSSGLSDDFGLIAEDEREFPIEDEWRFRGYGIERSIGCEPDRWAINRHSSFAVILHRANTDSDGRFAGDPLDLSHEQLRTLQLPVALETGGEVCDLSCAAVRMEQPRRTYRGAAEVLPCSP